MEANNQTAADQVVRTIKAGMEKGTFKVGDRLPSQRQLAEMFGVSRLVIREAVKVMEGQGILISRRGSGSYIKQSGSSLILENACEANRYSLGEIVELCEIVWESAAGKIARTATDEELHALLERTNHLYDNFSQATEQQKFIYESSFGLSFCKLMGNRLIYSLMLELLKATSTVDYEVIASHRDYRNILTIDKKLLESLLERDAGRARFWSRERDREIARMIDNFPGALEEFYNIHISYL